MQVFPCPFCGDRNETEFHFAGELGKLRPDTTKDVSDAEWASYLYTQRNEKGGCKRFGCICPAPRCSCWNAIVLRWR